jgi:hypothetical protein
MFRTPLFFAKVDVAASGDSTIVAAPGDASRRIVVAAIVLNVDAEVDVVFKTGSTELVDLGGFRGTGEPAGLALGFNPHGYFECAAGQALVLNLSGAVAVRGFLDYFIR